MPRLGPRLLAALAVALTLLRHRRALAHHVRRVLLALHRAQTAVRHTAALLSLTAADTRHYLHPTIPPNSRIPPPRLRRGGVRIPTPPTAAPPRSLRRLLRLAASPDGLAVLHAAAAGATHSLVPRPNPSSQQHHQQQTPALFTPAAILEALGSPAGLRVVTTVVASAVREALSTPPGLSGRMAPVRPPLEIVTDALLSDRGRVLAADVAGAITRAAVPVFLSHSDNAIGPSSSTLPIGDGMEVTPSRTASPTIAIASTSGTPGRTRPPPDPRTPIRSRPRPSSSAFPPDAASPVTKRLVTSVLRSAGPAGIVERLAVLAIRDRALVRDVVRAVVAEGLRAYLVTQAELRAGGPLIDGDVFKPEQNGSSIELRDDQNGTQQTANGEERARGENVGRERARTNAENENPRAGAGTPRGVAAGTSLWKVLLMSVAVDLKRALRTAGERASSPGWTIF